MMSTFDSFNWQQVNEDASVVVMPSGSCPEPSLVPLLERTPSAGGAAAAAAGSGLEEGAVGGGEGSEGDDEDDDDNAADGSGPRPKAKAKEAARKSRTTRTLPVEMLQRLYQKIQEKKAELLEAEEATRAAGESGGEKGTPPPSCGSGGWGPLPKFEFVCGLLDFCRKKKERLVSNSLGFGILREWVWHPQRMGVASSGPGILTVFLRPRIHR